MRRTVRLECFVKSDTLMLTMQNLYAKDIEMENGIPTSSQEGHGFGCRSIAQITNKRNGHCTFEESNGMFNLRVILPLAQ